MESAAGYPRWARWCAFFAVALIGLAVRLPQLGARPMHTDEAENAYVVGQLLAGETYKYDPQDRHGPALSALALLLARMQGARTFPDLTESELRLASVVAGTITILLFGAAAEIFGFVPSLVASFLWALAPLPAYYDRYFIHESLFCMATFGLILSAWHVFHTRSVACAALAGTCAAALFASKETAVLHWFALAAAGCLYSAWNLRGERSKDLRRSGPLLAASTTFLVLTVVLFTWFGREWRGLAAVFRFAPHVIARASGQGHEKPFWYYGRLLAGGWSGGLLLALGCLGVLIALRRRAPSPWQFLAYYGLVLAAMYSAIRYKTPWLALNLWLPLVLLAGNSAESLRRCAVASVSRRAAVPAFCVLAALAGVLIAHDTRETVLLHPADESNPYAYAHTSDDISGIEAEIEELATRGTVTAPRIAVIASDPWPLPWYLRHFDQVGFYQPGQHVPEADLYITSTEAAEQYSAQLRTLRPEFFGVRPNVLILLWSPEPK